MVPFSVIFGLIQITYLNLHESYFRKKGNKNDSYLFHLRPGEKNLILHILILVFIFHYFLGVLISF